MRFPIHDWLQNIICDRTHTHDSIHDSIHYSIHDSIHNSIHDRIHGSIHDCSDRQIRPSLDQDRKTGQSFEQHLIAVKDLNMNVTMGKYHSFIPVAQSTPLPGPRGH